MLRGFQRCFRTALSKQTTQAATTSQNTQHEHVAIVRHNNGHEAYETLCFCLPIFYELLHVLRLVRVIVSLL